MSTGREDLFRLIQSMSKSEKRYFKMESKKAGAKTSNHIKLFDAINNLEEYDEDVLKKKLKKEKFIEHLSAEKRYLYQAVLRSIRNFRGDQSIFAQIKTLVLDANNLLERGLYIQAEKMLEKAEKLASKIDDTVSLLEINLKKQELSRAHKKNDHQQELEALMKDKDEIVELLLTKLKLRDVLNQVAVVYQAEQDVSHFNKIKGIIEENVDWIEHTQKIDSFFGIYCNTMIRSFIYNLNGESEKLFKIRSSLISLWNQYPEIKEEFYYQFLVDLNSFIGNYIKLNQNEKAFELLQELENEKPKSFHAQVYIFKNVAIKKLLYLMNKGAFEEALLLIPNIEKGIKKYNLNISSKLALLLNTAILYYCIESYKDCIIWVNKIIKSYKSNHRLDVQRIARLLEIVAQIEIENDYETIDNLFRSTQRFFKNTGIKEKNQSEFILLDHLWKYHNSPKFKQKEVLINFKASIDKMKNHKTEKSTPGSDELYYWVRSKLEKKPIAQLIKESYKPGN